MRILAAAAGAALCCTLASDVVLAAPKSSSAPVSQRRDGSLVIAGRVLRCGSVRNVLDRDAPDVGIAAPGVLVMNPALLGRFSETVRLFVFNHECGHHRVGPSEVQADCWAVNRGISEGWLNRSGLAAICRSLRGASDPPSSVRCRELDRCFAAAMANRQRTNPPPAPAVAERQPDPPALVSGPSLAWEGEPGPVEAPVHGFGAVRTPAEVDGGR